METLRAAEPNHQVVGVEAIPIRQERRKPSGVVQGRVKVAVPVDVTLDRWNTNRPVIVSSRSGRLEMSAKLDGIEERTTGRRGFTRCAAGSARLETLA